MWLIPQFTADFVTFTEEILCAVWGFAKLFHAVFTSAYIMLFSMILNENIVDTKKPDGIWSPTFVVDEFSGVFLHP